jgi:hypothetical protein
LVENHITFLEDDNGIDDMLHFTRRVGSDESQVVFSPESRQHLPQAALGRDVQSVGGFVQQQHATVGGQTESQHEFFLLAEGQACQGCVCRHL